MCVYCVFIVFVCVYCVLLLLACVCSCLCSFVLLVVVRFCLFVDGFFVLFDVACIVVFCLTLF